VRCSNERPSCKRCTRLRRTCIYADATSSYDASQSKGALSPRSSKPTQGNHFPLAATSNPSIQSYVEAREFGQLPPRPPTQESYLGIPRALLSNLIDVFYSHIYNASLLLRKSDFLESLAGGTARHHLVLSVCAFAAMCGPCPYFRYRLFADS
jgi:hypothetical protein